MEVGILKKTGALKRAIIVCLDTFSGKNMWFLYILYARLSVIVGVGLFHIDGGCAAVGEEAVGGGGREP